MLADFAAAATIAVRDLEQARPFYQEVIGLKPVGAPMRGAQAFTAAGSTVVVYESRYAGTNQATAATWTLGGRFDAVMDDLRAKGVTFEEYPMPGVTIDRGVHKVAAGSASGPGKVAWFKDPDGNIHNLNNG